MSANNSFVDYLDPECIILRPENQNRADVVSELLDILIKNGKIAKGQLGAVSKLLKEREEKGSTAIGGGVAIPHARIGFSDDIILAFALLDDGVGFNALDGGNIKYVFLILTPKDDDAAHIACLKSITAFTGQPMHLNALNGCKTPEEVIGVFRDYC